MVENERTKIWVTKWVFTEGIVETEAVILRDSSRAVLYVDKDGHTRYVQGKNWHRTKEAAIKRAEEMRSRKIASLQKQIRAIEALRFE